MMNQSSKYLQILPQMKKKVYRIPVAKKVLMKWQQTSERPRSRWNSLEKTAMQCVEEQLLSIAREYMEQM